MNTQVGTGFEDRFEQIEHTREQLGDCAHIREQAERIPLQAYRIPDFEGYGHGRGRRRGAQAQAALCPACPYVGHGRTDEAAMKALRKHLAEIHGSAGKLAS